VAASQLSSVQGLASLQFTGVPARHVEKAQASPVVQAFPSSQAIVLFTVTQPVAGLQLSVVQRLPSSQLSGVPTQAPPEHVSPVVQALPSLHAFTLLAWTQSPWASHVSVEQGLPSSHSAFVVHDDGSSGPDETVDAIESVRTAVDNSARAPARSAV
jgi:hypothetical protein